MKENPTGTEVSTWGNSKAINWDTGDREISSGEESLAIKCGDHYLKETFLPGAGTLIQCPSLWPWPKIAALGAIANLETVVLAWELIAKSSQLWLDWQ